MATQRPVPTAFGNAALFAAITLSLVRLHWIIGQIRALVDSAQFIYVVPLIGNSALLAPLPALLALIYKAGDWLTFTKRLRHVALITALIYGVILTAPETYGWTMELRRGLMNIRLQGESTVAASLWSWFRNPDSAAFFWSIAIVLSEIAFPLFLVAVFRRPEQRSALPIGQPMRLLLGAAQVATVAGVLAALLNIGQQIYAAVRFFAGQFDSWWMTRSQFVLRNAVGGLRQLCWAAAPWIVYKAICSDPRSEAASPSSTP